MSKRRHTSRGTITRRQFLRGSAWIGAGAAFFGAVAAFYGANNLSWRSQVVVLPNGAQRPEQAQVDDGPVIVGREAWGALPVNHSARNENGTYQKRSNPEGWYRYPPNLRASYQTLIIHHSAFYKSSGLDTLLEIQRLHRDDRGWADIGYHFLIDKLGTIYEGRDLNVRGAHTASYNTGSAGICLMGDFRSLAPPARQVEAAQSLIPWLVDKLAPTHLAGHQHFNAGTACPGTYVIERLQDLADAANLQYGIEGYVPAASAADTCGCCACDTVM